MAMKGRIDPNRCSQILKALADPERLKILELLRDGPQSVGEIAKHLKAPIANASHHLKQLRTMGLVRPRKQGRSVLYSIAPAVAGPDNALELGCCRLELGATQRAAAGPESIEPDSSEARGSPLKIVNASFEQPRTQFVATNVTGWTIVGPPDTGVAGVFNNDSTASGSPARIDNVDGKQLAFISTESGNELSQAIAAKFEAGWAYELNVGIALSFALPPRATDCLRIALFHGTGAGRRIVAQRDVVNSAMSGLSASALKFFSAATPVLVAGDPAIGQKIGILIAAMGQIGGYFNLDGVTLYKRAEVGAMAMGRGANSGTTELPPVLKAAMQGRRTRVSRRK
jgi:DNA-binding transcriptional ArsR family regulator